MGGGGKGLLVHREGCVHVTISAVPHIQCIQYLLEGCGEFKNSFVCSTAQQVRCRNFSQPSSPMHAVSALHHPHQANILKNPTCAYHNAAKASRTQELTT